MCALKQLLCYKNVRCLRPKNIYTKSEIHLSEDKQVMFTIPSSILVRLRNSYCNRSKLHTLDSIYKVVNNTVLPSRTKNGKTERPVCMCVAGNYISVFGNYYCV